MNAARFTPAAAQDLDEICDFIAQDSPQNALMVVEGIEAAADLIGRHPGMGKVRRDLYDEPVRTWHAKGFVLIYRYGVRPVQILRVLHGARDLPTATHAEG